MQYLEGPAPGPLPLQSRQQLAGEGGSFLRGFRLAASVQEMPFYPPPAVPPHYSERHTFEAKPPPGAAVQSGGAAAAAVDRMPPPPPPEVPPPLDVALRRCEAVAKQQGRWLLLSINHPSIFASTVMRSKMQCYIRFSSFTLAVRGKDVMIRNLLKDHWSDCRHSVGHQLIIRLLPGCGESWIRRILKASTQSVQNCCVSQPLQGDRQLGSSSGTQRSHGGRHCSQAGGQL